MPNRGFLQQTIEDVCRTAEIGPDGSNRSLPIARANARFLRVRTKPQGHLPGCEQPTRADDIVINLNNHFSTIAVYEENPDPDAQNLSFYTAECGKYFYLHSHFVPHGEAASPEFSASHVASSLPDTAWHTPHTPGVGDALSLEITKPDHIDQVGIIPGCGSKEQDWFSSARIKAIEVVVNDRYTRQALFPDEFTFPWPESHKAYEWIDLPPYPGKAETIRLIIRSVYPGSADQVTCIGKVVLRQWLTTRPAIKSGIDGHELP
jgi:hypothetical protein